MKEFIAVIALIALGLFLYTFTMNDIKPATKGFLDKAVTEINDLQPNDGTEY